MFTKSFTIGTMQLGAFKGACEVLNYFKAVSLTFSSYDDHCATHTSSLFRVLRVKRVGEVNKEDNLEIAAILQRKGEGKQTST